MGYIILILYHKVLTDCHVWFFTVFDGMSTLPLGDGGGGQGASQIFFERNVGHFHEFITRFLAKHFFFYTNSTCVANPK